MLNLSWSSTPKDFKTYMKILGNKIKIQVLGFPFLWSICIWRLKAVKVSCQNYNSEKEKKSKENNKFVIKSAEIILWTKFFKIL